MDSQSSEDIRARTDTPVPRANTAPLPSKSKGIRIHSQWKAPIHLPLCFPPHLSTFFAYTTAQGQEIPLLHRDKVTAVLRQLHAVLKPVVYRFGVRYTVLAENHPQEKLAALTLQVDKFFCIRVRVRDPSSPNDRKKFYGKGTLLALLFHELAHVKFMHHGRDFMLLLRDIYRFAASIGAFPLGEVNRIPSCRSWEKRIYETAGNVLDEELTGLMEELRTSC